MRSMLTAPAENANRRMQSSLTGPSLKLTKWVCHRLSRSVRLRYNCPHLTQAGHRSPRPRQVALDDLEGLLIRNFTPTLRTLWTQSWVSKLARGDAINTNTTLAKHLGKTSGEVRDGAFCDGIRQQAGTWCVGIDGTGDDDGTAGCDVG